MSFEKTKLADSTLSEFSQALSNGYNSNNESVFVNSLLPKGLYVTTDSKPSLYFHNIRQFVMEDFLKSKGFKKTKETAFWESRESSPAYETIETNLNETMRVYKRCLNIYENKKKESIAIFIEKYSDKDITYRLYSNKENENLLTEWDNYAIEHNFYKNKKINASCEFLNLGNISWDDIILPKEIMEIIKSNVGFLFKNKEIFIANKLLLKRGVILSGSPGVGKTRICKAIAKETDTTVIYALPSHLTCSNDVRKVCEMAKSLSPCILIIEDIDWVAKSRDISSDPGLVIELMNYLEGIEDFSDVITLATTNDSEKIEEAVKNRPGRFDRVIEIKKPNKNCREKMLKKFTENFITTEVDFSIPIKEMGGYSGAHIRDLCQTAALYAIKDGSFTEEKKIILKNIHFKEALKEVMHKDYTSYEKSKTVSKKTIGFGNYDPFDED